MRGRVVVDASVALKWMIPEDYAQHALKLRDDLLDGLVEAHAPSLLLLEAASALRKYTLRGVLSRRLAARALELLAQSGLTLHHVTPGLAQESLQASLKLGITPYDAAYIVLARSLNAPLYTADDKLLENPQVKRLGIAKHITEYLPTR